jgi:hypothetical protein
LLCSDICKIERSLSVHGEVFNYHLAAHQSDQLADFVFI